MSRVVIIFANRNFIEADAVVNSTPCQPFLLYLKLVNPRIRSLHTKHSRNSRARALDSRAAPVYSSLPEPSRQKSLWHVVILANRSAGVGIVLTQLLEGSHPVVVVVVVVPFPAVLTA